MAESRYSTYALAGRLNGRFRRQQAVDGEVRGRLLAAVGLNLV